MSFAIAWAVSTLSMLLIVRFGVVNCAATAVALSREAAARLLDDKLSDDMKEAVARRGAVEVGRAGARTLIRLAFALGLPALLPAVAIRVGWTDEQALLHAFWSWPTLMFSLAALLLTYFSRS